MSTMFCREGALMRLMLLSPLCLLALACQQSSQYVTREELRDLFAVPPIPGDEKGLGAEDRRQRIELLVGETFAAPDAGTRAAAALTVAGDRTAQLTAALTAIDMAFNVCASNLANLETTAYKASYASREATGTPVFHTNFEQGGAISTSRQLDLMISGQGFFKVKLHDSIGDGFAYTRNGNFFVNRDGVFVLGMGDGYKLEPGIILPKGVTDISIGTDGNVEVILAGKNSKQRIGRIQLHQFMNPEGLNLLSGSLYTQTDQAGPPIESRPGENGAGQLLQGYVEGSNVDANKERLRMRFLQNWRAMILKVIDEMK
jgi:flagellar basal body rod protein FlgG